MTMLKKGIWAAILWVPCTLLYAQSLTDIPSDAQINELRMQQQELQNQSTQTQTTSLTLEAYLKSNLLGRSTEVINKDGRRVIGIPQELIGLKSGFGFKVALQNEKNEIITAAAIFQGYPIAKRVELRRFTRQSPDDTYRLTNQYVAEQQLNATMGPLLGDDGTSSLAQVQANQSFRSISPASQGEKIQFMDMRTKRIYNAQAVVLSLSQVVLKEDGTRLAVQLIEE